MGQLLLILVVALVVGGIVFGVAVLITGTDRGLGAVEPDECAVPLPTDRPLVEGDVARVRFDTALRGYRMAQVDQALRRAAYDIGYKDELISVLEAEVLALRAGRTEDAEVLRRAREAALAEPRPDEAEPDDGAGADHEAEPDHEDEAHHEAEAHDEAEPDHEDEAHDGAEVDREAEADVVEARAGRL
jgi:DivIVA domain-containing protein